MKKFIGFLLILVFFFSCSKEKEQYSNNYNSYKITMTNEYKLLSVEYYNSSYFQYVNTYQYDSNTVVITQKNSNDYLISKQRYFLNNVGIADSSIDSIYTYNNFSSSLSVYKYSFSYDTNGYKTSIKTEVRVPANTASTMYSFVIADGNIKSFTDGSCTTNYEYTTEANTLDVVSFTGNYNGKNNKNLIKSYKSDCSGTIATVNYSYTPDSARTDYLIKKRIETSTTNKSSIKQNITTTFEYVIK